MFKKMSLKVKYVLMFISIGLIPLIIISFIAYQQAEREITEQVFRALDMYASLTDAELEQYFAEREGDAIVISTTRDVYQSLNILRGEAHQGATIRRVGDTSAPMWLARVDILNDLAPTILEEYGYAVFFITDGQGQVVYSTAEAAIGQNLSDRDYVQGALRGNNTWSELFYSTIIHDNCMVISVPVFSEGRRGSVIGTLNFLMDENYIGHLVHEGLHELGETSNSYLIDDTGLLLSNTLLGQFREGAALKERINTRAVEILSAPIRRGDMDFHADEQYLDYMGNPVLGALEVTMLGDRPVGLIIEINVNEAFAGVNAMRNTMLFLAAIFLAAIAIISFFMGKRMAHPIEELAGVAGEVASGDLRVKSTIDRGDEIGLLATSFNNMVENLHNTIIKVIRAADTVSGASSEIAEGNQDLSQRTEEQASALEETSSTIQEIASSLQNTAQNSTEGDRLSKETMSKVNEGENVVEELEEAMKEISTSSASIAEIISSVNDIAFQTNLLALNAAVEAARAGEQGRGFAVVAAEVRNLAGRAAESALEIEKLIKSSLGKVEKGNSLMTKTKEVLKAIVSNAQKTGDVVGEIAATIREQSAGAEDIRQAIEELNQATQQNASLVEEIASSSESLNSESIDLRDVVHQFQVEDHGNRKEITKKKT